MTGYCPGDCAFLVKTRVDTESCKGDFWYCGASDHIISVYTSHDGLMPGCECDRTKYVKKKSDRL